MHPLIRRFSRGHSCSWLRPLWLAALPSGLPALFSLLFSFLDVVRTCCFLLPRLLVEILSSYQPWYEFLHWPLPFEPEGPVSFSPALWVKTGCVIPIQSISPHFDHKEKCSVFCVGECWKPCQSPGKWIGLLPALLQSPLRWVAWEHAACVRA